MLVQINYQTLHNYTYLFFMEVSGLMQGEEFETDFFTGILFTGLRI